MMVILYWHTRTAPKRKESDDDLDRESGYGNSKQIGGGGGHKRRFEDS